MAVDRPAHHRAVELTVTTCAALARQERGREFKRICRASEP
jgi:hypothetical protein